MLREAPEPLGVARLADRLGVHPNTVRVHLDDLVAAGRVEHAPADRGGPGRPAQRFRWIPGMDPSGPRDYRALADVLVQHLADTEEPATAAVGAGRAWGRRLAAADSARAENGPGNGPGTGPHEPPAPPLERLLSLLTDLGFDPEARDGDDGRRIGLRHCPFLELAEPHQDVVCPVHLGLMQGATESWDAPFAVTDLVPFAEPGLCLVRLTSAGAPR